MGTTAKVERIWRGRTSLSIMYYAHHIWPSGHHWGLSEDFREEFRFWSPSAWGPPGENMAGSLVSCEGGENTALEGHMGSQIF